VFGSNFSFVIERETGFAIMTSGFINRRVSLSDNELENG
jgi:hypothetical protein